MKSVSRIVDKTIEQRQDFQALTLLNYRFEGDADDNQRGHNLPDCGNRCMGI